METKRYKWCGPSGYVPIIGMVQPGTDIPVLNEKEIQSLLDQNLIKEIKITTSKTKG